LRLSGKIAFTGETRKFQMSAMFWATVENILDDWRPVVGFCVATGILATAITAVILLPQTTAIDLNSNDQVLNLLSSPTYLVSFLVAMVIGTIASTGLTFGLVKAGSGGKISFGLIALAGLRYAVPLAVWQLIFLFAIVVGLVLVVVPALIIATIWCLGGAALVAENRGIFSSFQRSRELTKGLRWQIFGSLVVFWSPFLIFFDMASEAVLEMYHYDVALGIVGSFFSSTIVNLLGSSFLASLYCEVVRVKEGGRQTQLAEIFA
jgi:hypothetical protein